MYPKINAKWFILFLSGEEALLKSPNGIKPICTPYFIHAPVLHYSDKPLNMIDEMSRIGMSMPLSMGTLEIIVNKVEKQMSIDILPNNFGKGLQSATDLGMSERKLGLRLNIYSISVALYTRLELNPLKKRISL